MLTCRFCDYQDVLDGDSFQIDEIGKGYWCEHCDGYTYLHDTQIKHTFTLILENKESKNLIIPSSDIKLSKRISPYRYPGGKSTLVQYLLMHIQKSKLKKLVSPYTGGGSFELALLHAGLIDQLHMNDLDTGVYAFWWTVKHMPYVLIERITEKVPSHDDYFNARTIIQTDYNNVDLIDAAWASLLVNRLAYSGIPKANPLGGRFGSKEQLLSRWNPNALIQRIEKVHAMSHKIEITHENAIELIEESYWQSDTTIFIDPPYVDKGKALYHCFYTEKDHMDLSYLLDSLYCGCPGADILVTYDYSEWLDQLYSYPNKEVISRYYSV